MTCPRLLRAAPATLAVAIALALAYACRSSTGPNSKTTGTAIVTVKPVANTTSFIVLTGPAGDTTIITGTDTVRGLPAGTYRITTAEAVSSAPIVSAAYAGRVTGSPATVVAGETVQISIGFAPRAGSGALWVSSTGGGHPVAAAFPNAQLLGAGTASESLSVAGAYGTFDASGNLWVADSAANTITGYPASALGATGAPPATVSITSGALQGPVGLTFDRLGNLWVANYDGNTVVEFAADKLTGSGSRTPAVALTGTAFDGPAAVAFDSSGDLWVANALSSTVVSLASASLAASGSPLPAVTLTPAAGSLNGPSGLAFDNAGDLWVANAVGNSIVEFQPSQIAGSGSATPFETLFLPDTTGTPRAIAFDNTGDLWTTSASGSAVLEYTLVQLAAGDSIPPGLTLPVAATPTTLAFDPPADSLPLPGAVAPARRLGALRSTPRSRAPPAR